MGPLQFGDTTLTKVFVGGLAWETQKDVLRHHFDKYGDILEAVIISDKLTGRSKGYGFVTFKDAESAKKACEDATPVINGRRANCNLASLGARRQKVSPPATPATLQNKEVAFGGSGGELATQRAAQLPAAWYYAGAPTQGVSPHFYQQYPGSLPFYAASGAYGYSPAYVTAADLGYSTKLSNVGYGGTYLPTHLTYHGGMASPNTMMPVYPMYQLHHHHHHHKSQSMGFPATHFFPQTTTGLVTTTPAIITKPKIVPPPTVCLAVE
ncbi:hypothetical protein KFK09_007369 [Dendrobium nobile]|uniref:RRM domain-containing protein n=1 Tax=Dendrobium nobile TaxID=94219 RepID=A0A8T3BRV2_DENNO|nr:hypothetical protein KFK09_007369 [Dendrobium nobile]